MRIHSALVAVVLAAVTLSGCNRYRETPTGHYLPPVAFGELLPPATTGVTPRTAALYVGSMPADAFHHDSRAPRYLGPSDGHEQVHHFFDAIGVLRFFPDGKAMWKWVPREQWTDDTATAAFGDDFTGHEIGVWRRSGDTLWLEFSMYALGMPCLAQFPARLGDDGLVAIDRYQTRKHGPFSWNDHEATIAPLTFRPIAVEGMRRVADW